MRKLFLSIFAGCALATAVQADTMPQVRLQTNMGDIVIALNPEKAPITVANFLGYAKSGFYDGTIFHRVIANFMIQGGGFTAEFERKNPDAPIQNEADNGLENSQGAVAMARTGDPHSATSQFFINVADNRSLNHKNKTTKGWGYAVFGQVVEGMDVVDKIRNVKTTYRGQYRDVPVTPVIIERAAIEPGAN